MREQNLIFLISQPRSGSTLLQKIIGNHSEIYTRNEPWVMLHPAYSLKTHGIYAEYGYETEKKAFEIFVDDLPQGEQSYIQELKKMYLNLYSHYIEGTGFKYFLDKTPRYYFIVDELKKIFPKSKFILLIRNPLAVLGSIINTWTQCNWFELFNHKHDLITAIETFINILNEEGDCFRVIRYEELLDNPEGTLKRLFKQLNLNYESNIVDFYDNDIKWRYGDPADVYEKKYIDSDNDAKWQKNLKDPQYWRVMYDYLNYIGPEKLNILGYNYQENLEILENSMPYDTLDELENNTFSLFSFLTSDRDCYLKLQLKNKEITQKDEDIIKKASALLDKEKEIKAITNILAGRELEITDKSNLITQKEQELLLQDKRFEVIQEFDRYKISVLESISNDRQSRINQVSEYNEILNSTLNELNQKYSDLERDNKELNYKYNDLVSNKEELQKVNKNLYQDKLTLEKQCNEQGALINHLQDNLRKLSNRLDVLLNKSGELTKEIAGLNNFKTILRPIKKIKSTLNASRVLHNTIQIIMKLK